MPVYNEAHRLPLSVDALVAFVASRGAGGELVFVDDGSTDETVRLLDAVEPDGAITVRVLRRAHEGKGAAVQAGILAANCEVVAFCDVDLATPVEELGRIIDVAEQGGLLAVGSRGLPTSQLGVREHRVRELLGKAFNRAVQLTLTPGIVDTQCGAKAAPRRLWWDILGGVNERGFAWDVDVIAQALAGGHPVVEVPIVWNHQPGSGVHVARDGARMLAALPRIRQRARRGARAAASRSWWFRSRGAYVNWALGRYARREGWLVDLGADGGDVTARLAWDRRRIVALAAKPDIAMVARGTNRVLAVAGDAAAPPVRSGGAEVVCLLDVIEPSREPVTMLRTAHALLTDGGVCVVTTRGHGDRGYRRSALRADLAAAGFHVEYAGHVFSWLLPAKLLRRPRAAPKGWWVDSAALVLTSCERSLLRFVSLPVGTTVLAVARRRTRYFC